jgi:hypothetical protein
MHFFCENLKNMRKWTNFCEIFAKILQEFSKNQKISRNLSEQMCSNGSIQLSLGLNFRFLVFAKVFVFSQKKLQYKM